MLQRIQSLFLLITTIAFAMLFFVNIYKVETTTEPIAVVTLSATTINQFQAIATETGGPIFQVFPFTLNLILLILSVIAIFWYKNRLQQNLLVKLLILLNSGLLVALLLSIDKLKALVGTAPFVATYLPAVALPFISLLMLYLASRAIMKDEKLVRSADRLR